MAQRYFPDNEYHALIVGSGGREHALAWALRRSPRLNLLLYCPNNENGNPAMDLLPDTERCSQLTHEIDHIVELTQYVLPDLIIIGPEAPLAAGLADKIERIGLGLMVLGPTQAGARLESSKQWAKEFMTRWQIPTAHAETFDTLERALDYLEAVPAPFVLKADGLAAGKGVLVTEDRAEARKFAHQVMAQKIFGNAGARLLIEEFMQGQEVSVLALCDTVSNTIVPLEPACDYKRAYDYDLGPNTGGMGAYSPTFVMTQAMRERVQREILEPTLGGLRAEKINYRGILYAGLMITSSGPKVVEYNVRMGDPETQSLLPRLKTDLLEVLDLLAHGKLSEAPPLEWDIRPSCGVVLTAPGYPGAYPKGLPIYGLENFPLNPTPDDLLLFHAGTTPLNAGEFLSNSISFPWDEEPKVIDSHYYQANPVLTDGGRVFNLVALGATLAEAQQRVYSVLEQNKFGFEGMYFRRDIAEREIK